MSLLRRAAIPISELLTEIKVSSSALHRNTSISMLCDSLMASDDEASKFDFVMEDGIEVVSEIIRAKRMPIAIIQKCLSLLLALVSDTTFHGRTVWDAFGDIDGVINLLEDHRFHESILMTVLSILSELVKQGIFRLEDAKILKHMVLLDLILEGVEENLSTTQVFIAMCHFLHSTFSPPLEVIQRLHSFLSRGLEMHGHNEHYHSLVEPLLIRFLPASVSSQQQNKEQRRSLQGMYGQTHCAPAA